MKPDILAALARYITDQAVHSARIVEIIPAVGVRCSAGDGSSWYVTTDPYACTFGWADTLPDALERLADDLPKHAEATYAARTAENLRHYAAQIRGPVA